MLVLRRLILPVLAALVLVTYASVPAFSAPVNDGEPAQHAVAQTAPSATDNEDLVPVALGTLGAIAVAGAILILGYLYRRQAGHTEQYSDGFTPHDPRDHPAY